MNRMIRVALFLWLALPLWVAADGPPMRLPGNVVPVSYRLGLTVDPDQAMHAGEVSIAVRVKSATDTIGLNATDIVIDSALLEMAGNTYPATARVTSRHTLDLAFATPLPPGEGELKIRFTGRIDDKGSQGLFRQREGGEWYAFTQFEASDARRAFPAFDEPHWKVPWTLALTIPEKLTAVANTAVVREVPLAGGMKRLEFLTTQPLPSYLLAFGVGPFDILDGGTAGATPVRFIAPRGRAAEARYAASMTPAILTRLEAYFGIAYPYGKLDVMALPITLNFGAMEHPGLVTFSSRIMLARPGEETTDFKRSFVSIQAHELAHQWFGDYVTMAWWDDIWLNESFASWMGDKITAQVAPQWRAETGTQQARARAMRADRLASARRIHQPVNDYEALGGVFDSITYSKGQATLAMFETWLGADAFQTGVQRYMVKHAWGNATGDDFVAALTGANSELANSFTSFTEQAGIPRLNVSLVCDGKPLLKLSQSRFLPRGSAASPASLWQIPVTVRTPAGQAQLLLKEADGSLPLPDASCPAWVEANVNGAGYYRPVYAPGALATLMAQGGLSVSELLANLDDAQALSESGDLPLAEVLSLALRYAAHSRREVVDAALGIISRMAPLIADDQRDAYAALWQRAFGRQGRALGLTGRAGDSDDDRLIRARWLGHLVDAGHDSGLRAQAKEFAQAWLQDRQAISAADRGLVLRSAAVGGDTALFEALVKAALASTNRAERRDIYGALGHFQAPQLAQAGRMLWLSPQHDIRELMTAGRERDGVEPVADGMLAFVMAHLPELAARLPNESVGRFPRFFSGLCGVDKAAQVEQFFAPQMGAYEGGSSALKQALEAIRLCGVYRDLQQASLNDFMALR